MATMGEIAKGKGKYLLTADIVGKEVTVLDSIRADTELKMTESEQYYRVRVNVEGKACEWNPTAPQLRAVWNAMNKPDGDLRGFLFRITGFSKAGFQSKTYVEAVAKVDAHPERQKRLEQEPPRNAVQTGVSEQAQTADARIPHFLEMLRANSTHITITDAYLDGMARVFFGDEGLAKFALKIIKSNGHIYQDGQDWKVSA